MNEIIAGRFYCPRLQKSAEVLRDEGLPISKIQLVTGITTAAIIANECKGTYGEIPGCGCEVEEVAKHVTDFEWVLANCADPGPHTE